MPTSYRITLLSPLLHVSLIPTSHKNLVPISHRRTLLSTLLHVSLIPISYNRLSAYQLQRSVTEHSSTFHCISFTQKSAVFWSVMPFGSVRIDVSEEPSASIIRVTRIGELGTMLALTIKWRTMGTTTQHTLRSVSRFLVTANVPSSPTIVILMMEVLG
jgi:hypothetical protein